MKNNFQFLILRQAQDRFFNFPIKIFLVLCAFFVLSQNVFAYQVSINQIVLNDPGYTQNVNDVDKSWGLVKTAVLPVWEKNIGSKEVVVAIIDTGIDATHEDLQSINFVEGFDVLNRKPISGKINSDDNGHGTLIAGVIGATPNNLVGIAGRVL
jgi:subtilisin family serine protease